MLKIQKVCLNFDSNTEANVHWVKTIVIEAWQKLSMQNAVAYNLVASTTEQSKNS